MIRFAWVWIAVAGLAPGMLLLGQSGGGVQTVREHWRGTWVGTNHSYMVTPTATAKITITVVEDKRPDRVNMDYAYLDEGKTKEEHFKRFLVIKPAKSSITIDRDDYGKTDFTVDYLDELLRTGYGDFTLHGTTSYKGDAHAVLLEEYHLTPADWRIEVYVSAHGGPLEKTGDWALQKMPARP